MADPKLLCPKCGYDLTHDLLRDVRPDSAMDMYQVEVECHKCLAVLDLDVEYEYRLSEPPAPGETV